MAWQIYQVVFRLRTPTHIGWGKVGNLQRTRPYISGRVLWGALTMRLTRDWASQQQRIAQPNDYDCFGTCVHQQLAFSYFYPATKSNGSYQVAWPWENPSCFRYRFLSSYSSTALSYPQQSAAIGTLHEVEFLAPHTIDSGKPVAVVGYVFASDACTLCWEDACRRLQVGGERGYGWGSLELECCKILEDPSSGMLGSLCFDGSKNRPLLHLEDGQRLLANTIARDAVEASGEIEPLVGREWQPSNSSNCSVGQHVAHVGVCFAPGSKVKGATSIQIGAYGVWEKPLNDGKTAACSQH